MKKLILVAVLLSLLVPNTAQLFAADKPINIALVTPIQIFKSNESITGLRWNIIYGKNADVTGLDLGIANHASGKMQGIQWGAVNLAGQGGAGIQVGYVNIDNGGTFTGLQYGWYNQTNQMVGLQFGLVNWTQSANGLQIGLINVIRKGGWFPVFPIINGSL